MISKMDPVLFSFCAIGGPEDLGPPTAQKLLAFCVLVGGPGSDGTKTFCAIGGPEDLFVSVSLV